LGHNHPLVDDHKILRQGLRTLSDRKPDRKPDREMLAEADDGWAAARPARDLPPLVVIMDARIRDLNDIEASRQGLAGSPDTKVTALSIRRPGPDADPGAPGRSPRGSRVQGPGPRRRRGSPVTDPVSALP
jgi:DNA-binding NarL/FixJ family response regulator